MPAVLAASGGIPAAIVGYRKKTTHDSEPGGKNAAGIVFVAPDGDILLVRRAGTPGVDNYVGHWALPGGGVEAGETPEEGARREAVEEIGRDTKGPMKPLDRRATPNGMTFHTFANPVDVKFAPTLNEEHSGYAWAPLNMLPRPLHPAVEQTLKDQVGLADDMAPEDWDGLRDGFLKWTQEEEAEGEHATDEMIEIDVDDEEGQLVKLLAYIKENSEVGHSFGVVVDPDDKELAKKFYIDGDGAFRIRKIKAAGATDSAMRLALDKDSVRSFDRDGRLRVERTHISKANVCPYRGAEIPGWQDLGLDPDKVYDLLRDPDELKKAAATLNGVPLLRKHVPVNAEDHQPHEVVGSLGSHADFDGEYLDNSLYVNAKEAIDGIESGKKRELSAGYHYKPDMTPGNFHGTRYDGVMRDIVFNHVALVEDGRAGPDVVVGDSTENLNMAKPTRLAALVLQLTASTVAPLLAKDSKLELPKDAFASITSKNFKEKKPALIAAVKQAMDGKVRKGLAFDDGALAKLLDALEDTGTGVDESVSEEQHKAMEAAAHGESTLGIPKEVGEEYVDKDKSKTFDAEPVMKFLREKGMSEDDITALSGLLPKAAATDEAEETEEEKAAREKKEREDKEAKDAQMKDAVTKPAMDAAIKLATETTAKQVRETERGIRTAIAEVRPWVGELPATLALDSADDVYRHAAVMLEIPNAKTIHASALQTLIQMKPKPGSRQPTAHVDLGMDESSTTSFYKRFPDAERIRSV